MTEAPNLGQNIIILPQTNLFHKQALVLVRNIFWSNLITPLCNLKGVRDKVLLRAPTERLPHFWKLPCRGPGYLCGTSDKAGKLVGMPEAMSENGGLPMVHLRLPPPQRKLRLEEQLHDGEPSEMQRQAVQPGHVRAQELLR